jgi:hypothetical protein
MRLWPVLPLAILAWLAAPAPAAERRPACTSATAQTAAIGEIQTDFERWRGRCVRLSGLLAERRLYADRTALAESVSGDALSRSIVVYPQGPGRTPGAPRMAEVVGTIGSCELHHAAARRLQDEAPDSIVWASGYCHTSTETYIDPVAIRRSGPTAPRLTEAELPADARPLVEAPQGTSGLAPHVAAARAMAAAIARRDEGAFLSLSDPDSALDLIHLNGERPPGWLRRNRREAHRKFAAQAGPGNLFADLHPLGARQERVMVGAEDLAAAPENPLPNVITCWCRGPDCTGRWPVLASDADNAPSRPYACIRTNLYLVHEKGEYIQADATPRPRPFAEP